MALIAAKGTQMTCENGHLIGTLNRDVSDGDNLTAEQFDWHIPGHPKDGDDLEHHSSCPTCGRSYIRDAGFHGVVIHTPAGWINE
jgi:hypothetical protein